MVLCWGSSLAYCQDDFPLLIIPGPEEATDRSDKPSSRPSPVFEESRPDFPKRDSEQRRLRPGDREFLPRLPSAEPTPSSEYRRDHSVRSPIVSNPPTAGDVAVSIRTSLLNRFIADQKIESNNVATRVMEVDVRGVQTTATFVQLQSAENGKMARWNVIAQGTVNSNTVGYTPQARITTAGNHTFNVIKAVYFDGRRFLTKPAYGGLQVRQTPQQVNTRASGMPLIGPIGDQIAWSEVLRRMPASDAVVVRRVADDVFPRVNQSVDQRLVELNRKWTDLQQRLRILAADDRIRWAASSTEDSFTTTVFNESVMTRTHDPDNALTAELSDVEAAAVVVSEDSTNHVLNRLSLNGLTISDTALQQLVVDYQSGEIELATLPQRLAALRESSADPLLFSLRFADSQPVGMRFRDGRLQLQTRFQILPTAGDPGITQLMTIQLKGRSNTDGGWALYVSDIGVEPASTNEQPDSWTRMIDTQASRLIDLIPQTELPRRIDLAQYGEKLPAVRIHRIQAISGQLRVSFKADVPTELTSRRPAQ